jgi:adenylate cyclase
VPDHAPVQRGLAAILAGDVAGYSHFMGLDEVGTLNSLKPLGEDSPIPPLLPATIEHSKQGGKTYGRHTSRSHKVRDQISQQSG